MDNNGSMGQPWGIAFSQTGMWAVTDASKHCIYVFDEQDNNYLAFKVVSHGNANGWLYSPYGVGFDSDNNLHSVIMDCNTMWYIKLIITRFFRAKLQ